MVEIDINFKKERRVATGTMVRLGNGKKPGWMEKGPKFHDPTKNRNVRYLKEIHQLSEGTVLKGVDAIKKNDEGKGFQG